MGGGAGGGEVTVLVVGVGDAVHGGGGMGVGVFRSIDRTDKFNVVVVDSGGDRGFNGKSQMLIKRSDTKIS